MVKHHHNSEAVYIFENTKAQRVKVGVSIGHTVSIEDRLRDVNEKWLETKATCQFCGYRRQINEKGLIPNHVVSGVKCPGSKTLPLEKDVTLAEIYLNELKSTHSQLTGTEKGSNTRIINNLKKRIELYRYHKSPVGVWQLHTAFFTKRAGEVELTTHNILSNYLDKEALFGEVFTCTAQVATEAVETALAQLGIISAHKEVKSNATSKKYGTCVICGGNLTERGSCPSCLERFPN